MTTPTHHSLRIALELITPSEIELMIASLNVILTSHAKLNPQVPDDCLDQLAVTLQHQYDRDRGALRQLVHQLECFGATLYQPDKVAEGEE